MSEQNTCCSRRKRARKSLLIKLFYTRAPISSIRSDLDRRNSARVRKTNRLPFAQFVIRRRNKSAVSVLYPIFCDLPYWKHFSFFEKKPWFFTCFLPLNYKSQKCPQLWLSGFFFPLDPDKISMTKSHFSSSNFTEMRFSKSKSATARERKTWEVSLWQTKQGS